MEKKGLKVVLADNNVQDRETRTKAIEEAGMQVVFSTGDGKKALDAIYREQPDIVVMDMILPGIWRTFAANCRGNEGKQHKTR